MGRELHQLVRRIRAACELISAPKSADYTNAQAKEEK
jgi:hypothetical protein